MKINLKIDYSPLKIIVRTNIRRRAKANQSNTSNKQPNRTQATKVVFQRCPPCMPLISRRLSQRCPTPLQ